MKKIKEDKLAPDKSYMTHAAFSTEQRVIQSLQAMGDKLKLLKDRQPCEKTARAKKQICNYILETLVGESVPTEKVFGKKSGMQGKPAANLTKKELDRIKLQMAGAAVI